MQKLVELMAINPRKRFNIPFTKDYTVWDLHESTNIDPREFLSKGRATPFEGVEVFGKCLVTVANGKEVYKNI